MGCGPKRNVLTTAMQELVEGMQRQKDELAEQVKQLRLEGGKLNDRHQMLSGLLQIRDWRMEF